jgi:ribosomal protein S19E (S16A)
MRKYEIAGTDGMRPCQTRKGYESVWVSVVQEAESSGNASRMCSTDCRKTRDKIRNFVWQSAEQRKEQALRSVDRYVHL